MSRYLLKNATIVNWWGEQQADLLTDGEKIAAVAEELPAGAGDAVIDCSGCLLIPGGIDAHTHFDLPCGDFSTDDNFFTATRAAVAGGTTTVIDYATQFAGQSLADGYRNWTEKASGRSFTDFAFHLAITVWHDGLLAEIPEFMASTGVTSFKLYMAYKGIMQVGDDKLFRMLRTMSRCGGLLCVHCENGDVIDVLQQEYRLSGCRGTEYHPLSRPEIAEVEAVQRLLCLARLARAPVYIVHLSTGAGLSAIRAARRSGQRIYVETCPQYLLLTDSQYNLPGFEGAKYVISPPLRKKGDNQQLWQGLVDGEIEVVATDHCAFNFGGVKQRGRHDFTKIPNGGPGVEQRLTLLYHHGVNAGRLSRCQWVECCSANPARIFGLYPRKGLLAVGSDADITVWDGNFRHTISAATQVQDVDYTPYEGMEVKGGVRHVFVRGRPVVSDGRLCTGEPAGCYLPRSGVAGL
ncbi:MAG: dihydropyrimidinase [Negativicutes bacterium]|nr:dihydropyrimidinase [Negativicutes bacterium]